MNRDSQAKHAAVMSVLPLFITGCGMPTDAPEDNIAYEVATQEDLDEIAGTYHVPNVTDGSNLLIRTDGTYTYDSTCCDSNTVRHGQVRVRAGTLVLVPEAGQTSFPCSVGASSSPLDCYGVMEIELRLRHDGGIDTVIGDDLLAWTPGPVCSICSTGGGNSHSLGIEPCDCAGGESYPGHGGVEGVPLCGTGGR